MPEHVILLHGLARSSRSFRKMATALENAGYSVDNCDYPSTRMSVEQIAEYVFSKSINIGHESEKIHFVTHSLGGIVLRYILSRQKVNQLGHVVMLAPPNQGSEVVDKLKHWGVFRWFNGPAGQQLGTSLTDMPRHLPVADYSLGVIAGNRSINLYLSTLLPAENDGKVSVVSTKLKGMKQHITLPVSHPFIMQNETAIKQTIHYLKHGHFAKND
jgi:triacylglycerol esterase/lipase EstA (alpha/beta hydrolase family)